MVMYKPHCGCNLSFSEVERSGYFKCLWLAKLYTSIVLVKALFKYLVGLVGLFAEQSEQSELWILPS